MLKATKMNLKVDIDNCYCDNNDDNGDDNYNGDNNNNNNYDKGGQDPWFRV